MKKGSVLSKAELRNVLGGTAANANCVVYSIETLDDGTVRRYITGTADSSAQAQSYASQHAQSSGGRFGYDCGQLDHQYYVS